MATKASGPIVVGVDGSPPSYRALDWSLTEARRRQAPLRLVHAADPFDYTGAGIAAQQAAAEETTAKAATYVGAAAPDIELAAETVRGNRAGSLVDESSRAAMVVVGNCGFGGFRGLLVGSVAVQVAAHARCPVIVVRPHVEPAPADGRQPEGAGSVVVGVDGSRLSETAIEFAFAEAALRGVGVTAVHAWSYPLVPNTGNADRPVGAPGAPAGGALHQPRLRSSGQDLDGGCEFGQDPRRVGEVHPRLRVAVEPVVDSGVPVPSPVPKPPTPRRRATGS